jgi:hypothetical protein
MRLISASTPTPDCPDGLDQPSAAQLGRSPRAATSRADGVSGRSTKRQAHWSAARIHSPPKMPAGTGAVAFRSVFAFVVLQTCNKPHSAIACPAPGVKFRPAQFHIMASQLLCVGRKLRPQQAWVHSEGNRGCISWPLSGPSEPPCRAAAIDRSCTTCAARGRSGSSVTAR